MPAVVRMDDTSTGDPCGAPPRPTPEACQISIVNNKGIHCVGHAWVGHACPGAPPHVAVLTSGSPDTFAEGKAVGRVGDPISCGSSAATGSPDTFVN